MHGPLDAKYLKKLLSDLCLTVFYLHFIILNNFVGMSQPKKWKC